MAEGPEIQVVSDADGLCELELTAGVRHGNVFATVGHADDDGQDTFTFELGVDS